MSEKYRLLLKETLRSMGERRHAEQKLGEVILTKFAKDPDLSRKERAKLKEIGSRMLECRTSGVHGERKGKPVMIWDQTCEQKRFCPDEARKEGARLGEVYLPRMAKLMEDPAIRCYYMVPTAPSAPRGELRKQKDELFRRWNKKFAEPSRRKNKPDIGGGELVGSLLVMEDPLSAKNEWNVHLNAIVFVRGGFDYGLVRERWGYNVEIREVSRLGLEKSLLEVVKYSVKQISGGDEDEEDPVTGEKKEPAPGLADWDSAAFIEWWRAGKGFRRTRAYGALYGAQEDEEGAVEDETTSDDRETVWRGSVRWSGSRYKTTWAKSGERPVHAPSTPPVGLILGHKSGNPELARVTEDVRSLGDDLLTGIRSRVGRQAEPEALPLTAHRQNTLSVAGEGGFIPSPDAELLAQIRQMDRALERERKAFELRRKLLFPDAVVLREEEIPY